MLTDIGAATPQEQEYQPSPLATLRKAITKLEVAGHDPSFVVVHPSDWETVELALSSTNAVEHLSLPYDPASRRLFGAPIVSSVSESEGVAHVVATMAVAVHNQGIQITWSETLNADDWQKNLIPARFEGCYGTSVFQPRVW